VNKSDAQHKKGDTRFFMWKSKQGKTTERRRIHYTSQVTRITKNLLVCSWVWIN